ncbi:MAG: class F sortase [Ktedonobacteraceae bacterium]
MKKLVLYASLIFVAIVGIMVYNYALNTPLVSSNISPTPMPAPWQPARLNIPSLHIDASVINVGKTTEGVMDAPTSKAPHSIYWTSVFWYDLGAAPGQAGNAVIAGHVDRVGGDPAIFWSLNSLAPGDKISVVTIQGKVLQFVVNRVVNYPASAPSQDVINTVFGPTTEHHLNLITCSGVWTSNGYDQRLVVFSTQIS